MYGPLAPAPVYRGDSFSFLEGQGSIAFFEGQMLQPGMVHTKSRPNGHSSSSQVDQAPFVRSKDATQGLPLTRIDWSYDPERLRLSKATPLLEDEMDDDPRGADQDSGNFDAWHAERMADHKPKAASISPTTVVLRNLPIRGNPKDLLLLLQRWAIWERFEFMLMPMKHGAQKNRGVAYVGLQSSAAAQRFVEAIDGAILPGRKSDKRIVVQAVETQISIDLRDAYATPTWWGPVFWTED